MDGVILHKTMIMAGITGSVHMGQLIQDQLKKDQRSVSWLAKQIPCTRNHVYKLFKRDSLDGDLLLRISIVMHFNFFQYYTAAFHHAMKDRVGEE